MNNPRVYIIGFNSQKRVNRALASIPDGFDKILLDNGSIVLKPPDGVEYHVTGPGMFTGGVSRDGAGYVYPRCQLRFA
jgi:hypothetical protein